ncbi:MAG: amylo-alpha-1,6-glucosidase [Acidobacteriota bacterium]
MFNFGQPDVLPPAGKTREWLLTNGIGGFAGSTISGINTRRYHGLLVASLKPPVDRRVTLAKLEEEIHIDGRKFSLFSSETLGGFSGRGFDYLQEFRRFPLPTYVYRIEDVFIEKEIMLVHGENTALIRYQVLNENSRRVKLNILPLITCRDYHHLTRKNTWPFRTFGTDTGVAVAAYEGSPVLYLSSDEARCTKTGYWYYNLFYETEAFRGLDSVEDLYCPVHFEVETDRSMVFWVTAKLDSGEMTRSWAIKQRSQELQRLAGIIGNLQLENGFFKVLCLAADSFLVHRKTVDGMSVIAGYPWFADWGRDSMIALPGLTLVTGRHDDYRKVMRTFLTYEKDGLIPNLFPDDAGNPVYNTVDASLWVFWSLYKYLQYTGDFSFLEEMHPYLKHIVDHYTNGTRFGIKMDSDGLVTQGEEGYALTWMDAKVHGDVITPRLGKAVEINALWHFALHFDAFLASKFAEKGRAQASKELAVRVRESFNQAFWFEKGGHLYDVVTNNGPDEALRCNQVIPLSLPVRLLDRVRERGVLKAVWKSLYTPYGLRTLAPESGGYCKHYAGDQRERDSCYHQGTAWVWPWGHFVTAVNRTMGRTAVSKRVIRRIVEPLLTHLGDAGLGTVSEIFDAEPPYSPGGCFGQAWSVAEVLRVYYEELGEGIPDVSLELES